jgi:hypothetical protein
MRDDAAEYEMDKGVEADHSTIRDAVVFLVLLDCYADDLMVPERYRTSDLSHSQ